MSTLEYRLKDPTYKHWVKTGLCLNMVKEGLEEYADIKSKEFHNAVLASVAKLKTHQKSVCDNERITFDNNNRGTITCNHTFCQGFLNAIVRKGIDPTQTFTIRKGNIDNCDVKLWSTYPWELAKLFMNPGQTPSQTNPSCTDLSGILNFLQHCQIPRNGIQNVQNIEKVRKTRNSVMHTPDMKMPQAMFQTETQTMLDLLQDPNVLLGLPSAQHAASEIQKVLKSDFQILLEDEISVIKALINTIKKDTDDTKKETEKLRTTLCCMQQAGEEDKKNLEGQIQQMEEETKKVTSSLVALTKLVSNDKTLQEKLGLQVKDLHGSLEQAKKDLWSAHNEMKCRLDGLEQKVSALETEECELKRRQDDIEQKVIFGAQERMALHDRQTQLESQVEATIEEEDCRKLRESIVKEYSRIYKDISLSPFGEELNDDALRVPIDTIYCDLEIVKIKGNRQSELETESLTSLLSKLHELSSTSSVDRIRKRIFARRPTANTRRLNSYSEMFADTEIKNIVIKGEGGTGKSTWCKRLLHAWCQVQRRELGMEGASDEANSDLEESLKRFHYLFYVTLRHVKYQSPLKDIFLSTGLDRLATKRKIFELILANKSENVLILLDGFDEYPFSLDCQGLFHSTIVMTTRPWKYDVLRSRDNNFKVDAVSEIRGLTDRGVKELSRKVIEAYNKQYPDMGLKSSNEEEQTEVYMGDISSAKWSSSIRIPLFLIITVLTWLENNKSLSKSFTCNILGLLKVIFQRGKSKLSQTDKQALKRAEQEKTGPSVFHEDLTAKYKFMCDNQVLLQHLGRLAYKGLTDQKGLSLVFTKDKLYEFLDLEELEICYKLGLLTGSAVTTSLLDPPQVSISFYHKLMQELFAAIGIISDSDNTLSEFTTILTSLIAVLEMENVILFITALNPCIGSYLSKHIAGLAETDMICEYRRQHSKSCISNILDNYNKLIFKCMFEWDSVHDRKEQKCLYLTDLIIDSDFDRKLRLCTYHNMEHLKLLKVKVPGYESVNIKQILSQLTTLTSEATSLQFLYIIVESEWYEGIQTMDIDLNKNEHLEMVLITMPLSHGQHFGLMFNKTVRLRTLDIQNAIINNTIYLQNITKLKLENVKLSEIGLPTRLEELGDVSLQSVTMPGPSWNTFFQTLLLPSLSKLTLKKPSISDITINLENSSRLWWIDLEDVKLREIRLPTRLKQLKRVSLQSVTMPGSSWNSFFQSLQSSSLTTLKLKNINIDDITINLENSSELQWIKLEYVKLREIRLPTTLLELEYVTYQAVTMPGSSWNSFFQSLQSPSLTTLKLKKLNINKITLRNCMWLTRLEISNMKLAEIDITGTEGLVKIKADEIVLPESQENSFFSQVLLSTKLRQLTMRNISLGGETVQFDRWDPPLKFNRWLDDGLCQNIQIQLENVSMSQESYECLCILLKRLKFSENQVTKIPIDTGLLNVTVFCKIEITEIL